MGLLAIQISGYDPGGFVLLKAAVEQCRREIAGASQAEEPVKPAHTNPPRTGIKPNP
jgi:hypothetical protein